MCGPQLTDMMPGLGASQPQWAPNSLRSASGPAPGHGFQIRLMNLPPSPNVEMRPVPELDMSELPLPREEAERREAQRQADLKAEFDLKDLYLRQQFGTPLERPEFDPAFENNNAIGAIGQAFIRR